MPTEIPVGRLDANFAPFFALSTLGGDLLGYLSMLLLYLDDA